MFCDYMLHFQVNGTLCEFEWQEELKLSVPSQPAHSRQGFECLELHVELLTQDGGILGAGVLDVSKYITAACWEAPDVVVNLGAPDACMQGSAGLLRLNVKLDVLCQEMACLKQASAKLRISTRLTVGGMI